MGPKVHKIPELLEFITSMKITNSINSLIHEAFKLKENYVDVWGHDIREFESWLFVKYILVLVLYSIDMCG